MGLTKDEDFAALLNVMNRVRCVNLTPLSLSQIDQTITRYFFTVYLTSLSDSSTAPPEMNHEILLREVGRREPRVHEIVRRRDRRGRRSSRWTYGNRKQRLCCVPYCFFDDS